MSEKRVKVLIVDDEPSEVKMVSIMLKNAGYEVEAAYSGKEGIEKALQEHFDLVLTDMQMPTIGGMRVLREVKREKPQLPVVMITGYASVKTAVQALKLGATHYFEKGFTALELIAEIEAALHKARWQKVEEQRLIHKDDIIAILERAATDPVFTSQLLYQGVDALDEYPLTSAEKLAILTGDIRWIEAHLGALSESQRLWLEHREQAEFWF